MTVPNVHIETEHGHVHVMLSGEIDLDTAPNVEAKLHTAIRDETSAVTFDLSGLTYIDSIGMRVLFHLAAKLEAQQVPFAILAEPGTIARRVVELSGLATVASLKP